MTLLSNIALKAAVIGLIYTATTPFARPWLPVTTPSFAQETGAQETPALQDVDALCSLVTEHYVYYDARKSVWEETCRRSRLRATQKHAQTATGHLALLEQMLDQLWDNHISLNPNSAVSPRLVPSGSDYWIEFDDGKAIVTAVRRGSGAAIAGLQIGDEIISMNSVPVLAAATGRMRYGRNSVSADRLNWALNAQAAGYRGAPRNVSVRRGDETLDLDLGEPEPTQPESLVSSTFLSGNTGDIRIEDSLGDSDTIAAFEAALEELREADGWIIDLRNTPGGGNTSVAEPIMGRFIRGVKKYQVAGPRWDGEHIRRVASRGPWRARGRVAVLVGRWTGSMGEGMAIGFDGLKRGRVYGSEMARLAGGVESFPLPGSGYSVRFPTYNLMHVDGTERHDWRPPYDVIADNGNGPDLALQAALDWVKR